MKEIKLIKNTFYNDDETRKELAKLILTESQLSMGKYVKQFEEKFAKTQDRKYCVMFNSGSSANLALLQSLLNLNIIKQGDNIGISGLTWITNFAPIIQLSLNPIPIDISVETLNISISSLIKTIKKYKPKVLFMTLALGFSGYIEHIQNICNEKGVILILDSCENLGTRINGKLISSYGLAATHSFYVGHHLSCMEGGAVITDDETLYEMLVMVRAHGWTRNLSDERKKHYREINNIDKFYEKYSFHYLAYNLRPMEIQGYAGLLQLKHLEEIILKRHESFTEFNEAVYENNDLIGMIYSNYNVISAFQLPIICKTKELYNKYLKIFEEMNIETRPMIAGNVVKQPAWKRHIKKKYDLPNCDFIHENSFYVSNDAQLNAKELQRIINCIDKRK